MVLRVKLEIVPSGEEDKAYEIGRLDIFNKGLAQTTAVPPPHAYGVIDLGPKPGLYAGDVWHHRSNGAWELVASVIRQLKVEEGQK